MTYTSITIQLPEALSQAIAARANADQIGENSLILNVLADAFGISPSISPAISEAIQPQRTQLEERIAELIGQLTEMQTSDRLSLTNLRQIADLKQVVDSLLETERSVLAPSPESPEDSSPSQRLQQQSADLATLITEHNSQQAIVLNQILSGIPDLIFVQDRLGRYTYVNPAGARAFECERNYLIGKTCEDLHLSADLTTLLNNQHRQVFISGQPLSGEITIPTTTASRDYEYIFNPIRGMQGDISTAVFVARDITERKQTEIALRESEEKYRNLFESATDSIFIVDAVTHELLEVNWVASILLGYTRRELFSIPFSEISLPLDTARRASLLRDLENFGSIVFEHVYRCKDGREIPVEVSSRVIEYENRLAILNFVRDITARKRAETYLRESEEKLRIALEAAQLGIWDTELTTGRITWSPNLETMFGFVPGEFDGSYETFLSHLHPNDRDYVQQAVSTAIKRQEDYDIEFRVVWSNGTVRWIASKGKAFYNEAGKPIRMAGINLDITNRKRAEELIHKSHQEFAQQSTELDRIDREILNSSQALSDEPDENSPLSSLKAIWKSVEIQRRRYRDLFNAVFDIYLVVNSSGVIQEASQAATVLFASKLDGLVGTTCYRLVFEQDRPALKAQFDELRQVKQPGVLELKFQPLKGNSFSARITISAAYSSTEEVISFCLLIQGASIRELNGTENASIN
ncbi:PAS domain S-box protein [Leptolyngbya sp. FACHB-671]|uniref:PAS domain S-box protein n=1 Tax=Leptolyngbya sp. FACHB-671 TaxID=2692812 RepID=UPI001687D4F8|nr:PAS domain S-box protein [Leptolyngbya sp. FACHB-671]MBD2068433.1 PAS domain S-box protein [Leptolyngbya sp. FACHB-671]